MLLVDLKDSDATLVQVVSEHCAKFGKVVSVKIHRESAAFAMVVMGDRMQTYEVAAHLGGSTIGTSALINLEQKP